MPALSCFLAPPGGWGPTGGADSAGGDGEEGVGAADRGDGGEGAGSPGSHRSSAGRQRLHQREARRPPGYTHAHTCTHSPALTFNKLTAPCKPIPLTPITRVTIVTSGLVRTCLWPIRRLGSDLSVNSSFCCCCCCCCLQCG